MTKQVKWRMGALSAFSALSAVGCGDDGGAPGEPPFWQDVAPILEQ